jgi:hypothetical protein
MLPRFLLPETVIREDGSGPEVDLGAARCRLLVVSMGITRILEQQSLDMSVWGSADNVNWGEKPLASFPQKFYCGSYQILVDLTERPEVQYLRAAWKVNRWGYSPQKPLFGLYLFVEESAARALARSA